MHLTRLVNVPAVAWRVLGIVVLAAAAAMILAPMVGCAPATINKPACPTFRMVAVQASDGQWFFLMDAENLERMRLRLEGLRKGTCESGPASAPASATVSKLLL